LANPKYEHFAYTTKAAALLVSKDFQAIQPISATLIKVEDVRQSVALLLGHFSAFQETKETKKQNLAFIHETATVAPSVQIGAFAYVSAKATVGTGTVLHEQVFVGENVRIGKNAILYQGVKIMRDCVIGDDCILHPNVVVGSDGFGFAPHEDGTFRKVPQIGNVIIGNRVEVGANTVIDRATMGATVIKDGVKLDNLIQIAHNVEIGENTVIAAQTGVAGSAKIGKNCMIGGQVGIVGHITVADGTKIQAQSGVAARIKTENTAWYGSPAIPYRDFLRSQVFFKQLPKMEQRIKDLEQQLKLLKEKQGNS
jgi:UDP-3-O-[3-hydroxymyristoyl] glucosamine N-acyltransferase